MEVKKNLLITGGNGFIGFNLIKNILENKKNFFNIFVLDSEIKCKRSQFEGINYLKGDIRNKHDLASFNNINLIIHLAADTRVIDSIEDPINNFDVNCNGTLNLLNFAVANSVEKFIFASTGGAIIGEAEPPVTEDTFPRPISPYGASKLAGESYIHAFAKSYGLDYCSLRFTNVYGPNSIHKESVVAHFIKKILKKETIIIYGDGKQTRDYIYVKDLANIILKSLEKKYQGVFQLGSGVGTKLLDLVSHIELASSKKVQIEYLPRREGEIIDTWADISKAKNNNLIENLTEIQTGILETYNWFKINYN